MAPRNSSPRLEIADFINNDTYRNPTECREPVVRTMDCTVYWARWREEREEKKPSQEILFEQIWKLVELHHGTRLSHAPM
jgi:hypothetical protein